MRFSFARDAPRIDAGILRNPAGSGAPAGARVQDFGSTGGALRRREPKRCEGVAIPSVPARRHL
jgi:hypothetical protein